MSGKAIRDFKDLEVWKAARALRREFYMLAKALPDIEKFGLASQLRRRRLGRPEMYSRPSKLWKTISIRRGRPVRRPVVVMSMVWPRDKARSRSAVRGTRVGCIRNHHTTEGALPCPE